jgi:hypothetical protein
MRRRFQARVKRIPALALIVGSLLFLFDWAGYHGKFKPLGEPRELGQIWWHLPVFVTCLALAMILWPWRIDYWDDI